MRIIITSLVLLFPLVLPAREEYKRDFQKTAALPAGRTLRVEHSLGSVNVRTQAKNEVAVQAAIRCSADNMDSARRLCDQIQIRVEEGASGVTIRTEYPRNGNWPRNMSYSANLEIQMPETAPLELRNRFGNVTVQKLHAPATINNGNGNVVLLQGSGRQRVENSFGNVEVVTNEGDVTVVNGNGWVRASDISGAAEITNRFGEVRVTNVGKTLTVHGGNSKVEAEHVGRRHHRHHQLRRRARVGCEKRSDGAQPERQGGGKHGRGNGGPADVLRGRQVHGNRQGGARGGPEFGRHRRYGGRDGDRTDDLRERRPARSEGRRARDGGNSGIRMAGIGGEVYAKTTFAGTVVEDAGGPVTVESGNGSVSVTAKAGQACKPIAIQTTFAPIRVAVPAGVGYTVTGRTSFGRIQSEQEMTVSGAIAGDSINGKINGGGCEMRLTNQNGNIDIVKRP